MPIFRKKKPKKAFSRDEFLRSKPVKNPYSKWKKSETGGLVITLELKKMKATKFWSKLFPPPKEKRISLDKIGTFVWERCDGKHTVEQIAKGLEEEYKMMRQEAEISLTTFLRQLSKRGLVGVLIPEVKEKKKEKPPTLRKMKI